MTCEMNTADIFTGQKVLVTGARGFLGGSLCRRLINLGADVYGLSRTIVHGAEDRIQWRVGSLEDLKTAENLFSEVKPDIVFHLAGHVTAAPDLAHVFPTFQSLLVSTVNLLTVATRAGCRRLVLTGSLTEPMPGRTDTAAASPYAVAKWASNAYSRMFAELYKSPCVIVRPFMTYGPGQDVRKLIPHVAVSLLRGRVPHLSSGHWQADWIYVDDVTEGFVLAAHVPGVEGLTFDFGTGLLASVRDVAEQVRALVGSSIQLEFGAQKDRPNEHPRMADCAFALERLQWRSRVSLAMGLKRTVEWYAHELEAQREHTGPIST